MGDAWCIRSPTVINLDGTGYKVLEEELVTNLGWSADGQKVVYGHGGSIHLFDLNDDTVSSPATENRSVLMTLFNMNFKVISRSLLFKIYIFFLSFVYLLLMWLIEWREGPQSSTVYLILDRLAPFEMALFVFSFCMAVYIAQQKYTLEKTCFLPRNQIIHNKLAALIACSCAICLLPTMSILLHAGIDQIGARFTLLAVLAIIPRWIVLIAFAETLGFICGSFISSFYIYLLVIPFSIIFSYLNTPFLSVFIQDAARLGFFSQLLSLNTPFIYGVRLDYTGPLITSLGLIKLMLIISVTMLLVKLLCSIVKRRPVALDIVVSTLLLICCTGLGFAYAHFFPVRYDAEEKLLVRSAPVQPFHVASYQGEIHLQEFMKVACFLNIQPSRNMPAPDLVLRLDEAFALESLQCEGKNIAWTRNGEYITIKLPCSSNEDGITLDLRYKGRLSYVSYVDSVNILTSHFASALPPGFAFLPMIDGDQTPHQFDLKVNANNPIASNLEVTTEPEPFCYRLSGQSKTICIFSGFLTSFESDGQLVYRAKYNRITDYRNRMQQVQDGYDYYTLENIELDPSQYDRVLMLYNSYFFANATMLYDDYLLINVNA